MTTPLQASELLQAQLEAAGMARTAFSAWEGWKAFKSFLRLLANSNSQGGSVQGVLDEVPDGQDRIILTMMRQFSEGEDDIPFAWVGLEVAFAPEDGAQLVGLELWSYDFPDWSAFAAAVEAHPGFQSAMNARALASELVTEEI